MLKIKTAIFAAKNIAVNIGVLGRGIPQHGEANNVKCPNANFTKFTALHNRDSYNHAFKLVVLLRHLGALPPDLTGVPPFDPLRTSIV